ncbi:MAG: hypothetical protein NVSMB9_06990 [Isosphaeraceae bacterium]
MIDSLRTEFPSDMTRAASFSDVGNLEHIAADALEHLQDYARAKPMSFGLWALGIGFVLGWKLKPW